MSLSWQEESFNREAAEARDGVEEDVKKDSGRKDNRGGEERENTGEHSGGNGEGGQG